MSRQSTIATSVLPPLIPQYFQLPSSASPDNQLQARLPGQWRHPAALHTFIFSLGVFRLPDRQTDRQTEETEMKTEGERKTMGRLKESMNRDLEKERLRVRGI